jgi:L-ascorbate metabolism protein UlaG (beta-lactamase superfamily)
LAAGPSAASSEAAKPQVIRASARDHAPRIGARFRNAPAIERPPLSSLLRWKLGRGERDPHHQRPCWDAIPRVDAPADLRGGAPALTWVGHATVLMQLPELTLLTDPVWFDVPGVPRATEPGLALDELPPIDVVLISHAHHDHLQAKTLARLPHDALYVVPAGLGRWMRRRGKQHVIELDWWDRIELGGAELTFVPAQHWSRRGLVDENRALWGGYVVASAAGRIYFAGDSGWFDGFAQIGERLRPEIALLPIGAYAPRWFMRMQHIDPAEALDAFSALGATRLLPIHWGSFALSDEPLGEPPAWIAELAATRGLGDELTLWPLGGTHWL